MGRLKLLSSRFYLLALAGVFTNVLIVFALLNISEYTDRVASEREKTVVQNGLIARIDELEQVIIPNVVWDDAVRNLDNSFDPTWAHNNIGQFFSITYGFQFAYVLDAANAPIYAMHDGQDEAPSSFENIRALTSKLVKNVRSREAAKSSSFIPAAVASNLQTRVQETVAARIGDRFFYVTASLVQPDFGTARIAGAAAPILITGHELDADFVKNFATRYMLNGAHVHKFDAKNEPGEAHIVIHDGADRAIATLGWSPQKPGEELLDKSFRGRCWRFPSRSVGDFYSM